MALEEQIKNQVPANEQAPTLESLTDEEEDDLELAVLTTERLLEDGGYEVIEQALATSKDPSQVIGQFMIQLIQKLNEQFINENQLSRRIWLCKGGWLEQAMDMVIDEFGLDYAVSDKAEVYVADTITKMAQAGQAAGPVPQPGQAPAAMPQGVPV